LVNEYSYDIKLISRLLKQYQYAFFFTKNRSVHYKKFKTSVAVYFSYVAVKINTSLKKQTIFLSPKAITKKMKNPYPGANICKSYF
jgi:hypothetical protein